jgi:hypothetical protein
VPRHVRRLACFVAALTSTAPQAAETVACHITYGGVTQLIEARPTTTPYELAPVAIGSYFLFRIVFRQEPADLAGIKLYAYVDRDSGPALIHQASYAYPIWHQCHNPVVSPGLHYVYEPVRDSELQYWCEQKAGADKMSQKAG